jgi:phage gp29-like protein
MAAITSTKTMTSDLATRDRFDLTTTYTNFLPDPDKILIENEYDYEIYRDLLLDPHLMATIQQRKMQVMQLEYEVQSIEAQSGKRIAQGKLQKELEEVFEDIDLNYLVSEIMDAIFFGYSVVELTWKKEGKILRPVKALGKPQEWFIFDKHNELRLRKYKHGFYLFEDGEKLPPYKFVLTQHKPTFTNPYGEKILSRCYWPVTLKKGGIEYWQLMMERYGMPYLIGRYPNTFTATQKTEFLEQLKQMVVDNITIFDEALGIELKESPQFDIGQLYENLVKFHNREVSKAVLTVTLTTEIEKTGSYKAGEVHKEMLQFLGESDRKLVESSLNKIIDYYCELNYGNIERPKIKLLDKEKVIEESVDRDKVLSDMGVKFSKEYFMKRYKLAESDFTIND